MILVDGPNWCWRAHFAHRYLASDGRPTGVLHGALLMLSRLPVLLEPRRVVFLWDSRAGSWRKKKYSAYKSNRVRSDVDTRAFYTQVDVLRRILFDIGIVSVEVSGLEADDLAWRITSGMPDVTFQLVSSDHDWFQLLEPGRVEILRGWDERDADWMDADRFQREYKILPEEWPLVQALMGCKSDNIPSIRKGVGLKTALRAVREKVDLCASREEKKVYWRNMDLVCFGNHTTNRRWIHHSTLDRPVRSREGWDRFGSVLLDYELHQVWSVRRKIWEVGGW